MLPQSWRGWLALGVGTALLAALPYFATPYYVGLATTAMIAAMLALALHLLVGATGLVSLGHGAFYGLAAYVVYLLSPEGAARPIWQTLPAAMVVAGVAALAVGALSLRTRGFFFLMVTLAFGQMIFFVFHDTKLGGGTDGAYLAKPLLSAFGFEFSPQSLPRARRGWPAYYVALVQLVATYLVLAFLLRSLFGRVLEGIKVNEPRMLALGFNANRYKLAAFTIAGMLAGAAGHMWSLHTGFVNPELVGWHEVGRGAADHPARRHRLARRRGGRRVRVLRPRRGRAADHRAQAAGRGHRDPGGGGAAARRPRRDSPARASAQDARTAPRCRQAPAHG